MVMLDFICMGSAKLFGTDGEQKIQNENVGLQWDSNPGHATQQQANQRLRPLGHGALMMISGLMPYRIKGFKSIKPLRDNTCQIDNGYMCI